MLLVEPTRDRDRIWKVAADRRIFRHISDDFITHPRDWMPPDSPHVKYFLASDDTGSCGFGAFVARTWAMWEAHIAFLPHAYGAPALTAFKEMIAWMFEHTVALRIIGEISDDNRLAIAFAKRAGFVEYGRNPNALKKGGRLRDLVCLGISKGR